MSRVKLWTGLIVLFSAGALSGIAGMYFYHNYEWEHRGERGPAAQHERIMERLTHELSLTATQRADIGPIVTRTHREILELRFAHQTEVDDILSRGISDLKKRLSTEQQAQLDELYVRQQQRWQKSREYLDGTRKHLSWVNLGRRVEKL